VPNSIWVEPNINIRKILLREVNYNSLPYDDQNEYEKGMLFCFQRAFVEHYVSERKEMHCESNFEKCLKDKCPLFEIKNKEVGGLYGICREFKICFIN
jgi:hypothetical protein